MIFNRVWAMPSKHTFTIEPIRKLLTRYVGDGKGWIDPFAGENSPAEITNDLNPEKPTQYHLHAREFTKVLDHNYNGILYDPPYCNRQIKECYDSIGIQTTAKDMQVLFNREKKLFAPKIKVGGFVICCGWNSGGFGKNQGFEMIEILLVPHGRAHYDTIVTVEQKVQSNLF